jgi:putative ABC transport system permease protein
MTALRSVRFALRALTRAPTFTVAATVAIALAIGASTAVFSVVNGVLLQPLAYTRPDELLSLYSTRTGQDDRTPPSYPDFLDWKTQARSFSAMAFLRGDGILFRFPDGVGSVTTAYVSEGFFGLLGVAPMLGRTFTPDEERPGAPRVIVLGFHMWRGQFGGDPGIVGRTVSTLAGPVTVIGVMPASFDFARWPQAYTPLAAMAGSAALIKRDFRVDNRVIGRLARGVSPKQASAELEAISRRLAAAYPADDGGLFAQVIPVRSEVVGEVRPALAALSGAVAVVLLVACANVANLSLVRASARGHETAVRVALGAGRLRVAGHALMESLVIALVGGAGGVGLAWVALRVLRAVAPAELPRLDEIVLDGKVLGFAVLACAATALACGVAPAMHAAGLDPARMLRDGARGAGSGRRGRRVRAALVVTELALALVLVAGTGLLLRSFVRVRAVDTSVDVERLLSVRLGPDERRYNSPEKLLTLYNKIRDDVAAIPGVASASIVNHLALTNSAVVTPMLVDGKQKPTSERESALYRLADERYFSTLGLRVSRGRDFTAADMQPTSAVIIVSAGLAKRLWPNDSPLLHRLTVFKQAFGRADYMMPVDCQVIGVVADTKRMSLEEPPIDAVYLPFPVNPWRGAFLAVRASRDPAALIGPVRRAVQAVEPDIPLAGLGTMREALAGYLVPRKFQLELLAVFAICAVVLAGIGVAGVITYGVEQRAHELGVRAALGASRRQLVALFVREGAGLAILGVGIGVALAAAATRVMARLVFGVGVRDATTFVSVAMLLGAVAVLASWLPARRAARVDPLQALRRE